MVTTETKPQKNIVFIGASSSALGACYEWNQDHDDDYRLVIIEARTHYNHVFAFPRATVIKGFEEELFIPYDNAFEGNDRLGQIINARVMAIHKNHVDLDRDVAGFGNKVEFEYLVYAAGCQIPAPGRFTSPNKWEVIDGIKKYQKLIEEAERPIIIGAGAVGLELASEIKEHYPEKTVTLLHSRNRYMPRYKVSLDVMTYNILKKKGVKQILGDRVVLPEGGFPQEVGPVEVHTKSGRIIEGDLAIMCIGMTPNSALMKEFAPDTLNPATGFIKVKPTMQIQDDNYPHIYAVGDVSDHTDVKIGHYAWMQGLAAITNIRHQIRKEELEPYKSKDLALIKLVLGEKEAVTQTHMLGPLVVLGSWIAGRNIGYNVYATTMWSLLHADITTVQKENQ